MPPPYFVYKDVGRDWEDYRDRPGKWGNVWRAEHREALTDLDLIANTILAYIHSTRVTDSPDKQDLINISTVAVMWEKSNTLVMACNKVSLKEGMLIPKGKIRDNVNAGILSEVIKYFEQIEYSIQFADFQYKQKTDDVRNIKYEWAMNEGKIFLHVVESSGIATDKWFRTKEQLEWKAKGLIDFLSEVMVDLRGNNKWNKTIKVIGETNKQTVHAEMYLRKYALEHKEMMKEPLYVGVSKPCCPRCSAFLDIAGIEYSTWAYVDFKGNNDFPQPPQDVDIIILS